MASVGATTSSYYSAPPEPPLWTKLPALIIPASLCKLGILEVPGCPRAENHRGASNIRPRSSPESARDIAGRLLQAYQTHDDEVISDLFTQIDIPSFVADADVITIDRTEVEAPASAPSASMSTNGEAGSDGAIYFPAGDDVEPARLDEYLDAIFSVIGDAHFTKFGLSGVNASARTPQDLMKRDDPADATAQLVSFSLTPSKPVDLNKVLLCRSIMAHTNHGNLPVPFCQPNLEQFQRRSVSVEDRPPQSLNEWGELKRWCGQEGEAYVAKGVPSSEKCQQLSLPIPKNGTYVTVWGSQSIWSDSYYPPFLVDPPRLIDVPNDYLKSLGEDVGVELLPPPWPFYDAVDCDPEFTGPRKFDAKPSENCDRGPHAPHSKNATHEIVVTNLCTDHDTYTCALVQMVRPKDQSHITHQKTRNNGSRKLCANFGFYSICDPEVTWSKFPVYAPDPLVEFFKNDTTGATNYTAASIEKRDDPGPIVVKGIPKTTLLQIPKKDGAVPAIIPPTPAQPQKGGPQEVGLQNAAPPKAAPQKATPQKGAPPKAARPKVAPPKAAPPKAAPPKGATPKQAPPQDSPKEVNTKKPGPKRKQATPKEVELPWCHRIPAPQGTEVIRGIGIPLEWCLPGAKGVERLGKGLARHKQLDITFRNTTAPKGAQA
ncbi:MAG: hypothetical protein M1831_001962 [Alyxoria varia]|nr:MAG: hypothetical protein M1831_001962 [Alyxoria varia]